MDLSIRWTYLKQREIVSKLLKINLFCQKNIVRYLCEKVKLKKYHHGQALRP